MMFFRRQRLHALPVCLVGFLGAALASAVPMPQQPGQAAQQPPAQQPPKTAPATPAGQQKKQANPFEAIPVAPQPTPTHPPAQPGAQQPGVQQSQPGAPPQNIIEAIEFRGSRRVPQDMLRSLIFSRAGDKYDEATLRRDFMALWNTGRFDDIRLEREPGKTGWIIIFVVTERPVIRTIQYEGNKSITVSEILDRFKDRHVGLSVESQYDPNKIQRARVVLQEFEAERGRQFATVTPIIHQLPPASLEVIFKIDEGPKVKVGDIDIEGNKVFSDLAVRRAMKNLKPIGIPHSILFEDLFARTYDSSKLDEDQERIRQFYMEHGYFLARVVDHSVKIIDYGGGGVHIPLIHENRPGKRANINLTVDEGRQYRLNRITFSGVKLFKTPEALMRPLFGMAQGDVFSTDKLKKGMDSLRKLYGEFGYMDFVVEPDPEPIPNTDKIDLNLAFDEGHQFFVRRIDFSGNTTTRDRVIRRELLLDEGDMYNVSLWKLSILRLNQLGYFEPIKEDEATDVKADRKDDVVDLTLKVKERGKNSIQLNGGVSGIAGSFLGFSYSTNNFLGLGETLSLSSQIGTREREVDFGFTEPYLFDKPIQAGFTIYLSRFNYDQGREASILTGENLVPVFNELGSQNLLNYVSDGRGFTVFAAYPLRRSFARLGISYGYNIQNITPLTTAATTYFDYLYFQNVTGPNALQGVKTSQITPSFSYNSTDSPLAPTRGARLSVTGMFSGSVIGGNVNTLEPQVDFAWFHKALRPNQVFAMHFLGRMITGYGGKVAPPFSRFYMGGEDDIRGFDIWGISPFAYIPTTGTVNVYNNDGSQRMQKILDPTTGVYTLTPVTQTVPIYQMVFPGGDTELVSNIEYRIKIFGPVTLTPFIDTGIDKLVFSNQLKLDPTRVAQLNAEFPEANFSGKALIAPGTQKMRMSTGLEIDVLMPVVNAPFRVYWAYNPSVVREYLIPPVVADRSYFPNFATYANALATIGQPVPFFEQRSTFRFTVGRTF
jgi:outer membrane protein insertion porin family